MLLAGRFFDYLLSANRPRLDGFRQWLFHPGMLFQARQQWWGKEKPRSTPHEGLDLCWFEDVCGQPPGSGSHHGHTGALCRHRGENQWGLSRPIHFPGPRCLSGLRTVDYIPPWATPPLGKVWQRDKLFQRLKSSPHLGPGQPKNHGPASPPSLHGLAPGPIRTGPIDLEISQHRDGD